MKTCSTVGIDAPSTVVWDVFSDVERWPDWTASVLRLVGIDGPELKVGSRFRIDQPRMPRLVWEVTELAPGRSWTWVQRSPGGVTTARHDVIATPDGHTVVRQELDQRGLLGAVVARLMHRMTVRYLELEAQGLKDRSEQLWRLNDSASSR